MRKISNEKTIPPILEEYDMRLGAQLDDTVLRMISNT